MKTLLSHPALCVALLVLPAAPPVSDTPVPHAPPVVAVTDLGTLGGSVSWGNGVNDAGQVAGTSQMPGDKVSHAFLYADGRMTDLGTLGGDGSEGLAVNDAGQVTGDADLKAAGRGEAFLWQQGHMAALPASPDDNSAGLAINGVGQVTGRVAPGKFGTARACLWSQGKKLFLDSPGAVNSDGNAVSTGGLVAGTLRKPGKSKTSPGGGLSMDFCDHAVLWRGRKPAALDDGGAEFSVANAVNDAGQVAGAAFLVKDKILHACVWRDGRMTDLGTLGEQNTLVYAINHAGRMVGGTNPNDLEENGRTLGDADQPQHAFCVSGGAIIDLNDLIDPASGWVLADARGLSDTGYVTGTGLHNGHAHAFLLKLPDVL